MQSRDLSPLNGREQAFLLTSLLFASQQYEALLQYMPSEIQKQYLEKAKMLLAIERNERVALMIAQLKRLLLYQRQTPLTLIHPSWVTFVLQRDNPALVAALFSQLPSSLVRQILPLLPPEMQAYIAGAHEPVSELVAQVVLRVVESRFEPMPREEVSEKLLFRDVISLRPNEILIVLHEIGIRQVAAAFAGLGLKNAALLLSKFPQEVISDVIDAIQNIVVTTKMEEEAARRYLVFVFDEFVSTEIVFRKAGSYFFACAAMTQPQIFQRQMAQRLPREDGLRLLSDIALVQKTVTVKDEVVLAFQKQVIEMIIGLAKRNKIDERFAQCTPSI